MLDVLGIFWRIDRRNDLVERDRNGRVAVEPHPLRRAVEVSRRATPLLAFAAVHRQLDCVTVRAFESLVAMHERLHGVLAGWQIRQTSSRITKRALVHRLRFARFPALDVDTEDLLRVQVFVNLKAWFIFGVVGNEQQQPSVDRTLIERGGESDSKVRHVSILRRRSVADKTAQQQDECEQVNGSFHGVA